jgi:hypothetical protein
MHDARIVPRVAMWSVSIERVVHALRIVRPRDRPHAPQQVAHLLGRVVEELGDDLDVRAEATIAATSAR